MVSEPRNRSLAWMETDLYSKHTHFRWKIKWRLEHLGALGIMVGRKCHSKMTAADNVSCSEVYLFSEMILSFFCWVSNVTKCNTLHWMAMKCKVARSCFLSVSVPTSGSGSLHFCFARKARRISRLIASGLR